MKPWTSWRKLRFQYRKRYGLHAIRHESYGLIRISRVSIPQAVWIACNVVNTLRDFGYTGFNTASGMDCMQFQSIDNLEDALYAFQYRKRYGLHAIEADDSRWRCDG